MPNKEISKSKASQTQGGVANANTSQIHFRLEAELYFVVEQPYIYDMVSFIPIFWL